MNRIARLLCAFALLNLLSAVGYGQQSSTDGVTAAPTVTFSQVAVVLSKYCAGCHNDSEHEGKFSVSSYASLMAGSDDGPVIVARNVQQSKLLAMVAGELEPAMPPDDEPRPSADEIDLLRQWIQQGARGDEATPATGLSLHPPHLAPAPAKYHHVGSACGVSSHTVAVGLLGEVQLRDKDTPTPRWIVSGLSGKVNSLRLDHTGQTLVVGCGIAGVGGEALLLNVADGHIRQRMYGHGDTIYCAALSPDGGTLATGSYDRKVILWDATSGEKIRELTGHNGAIYDLDFDHSGQLLATASADQTVKLWRVATGQRLDTLGQPEGEQRCVRFSPDGQTLVAAGSDKQIRQWQVVSRDVPAINPMLVARFAHEADIVQLAFLPSGHLISTSTDQSVKLWQPPSIVGLGTLAQLSDVPVGLCLATAADGQASVIQLDGRHITFQTRALPAAQSRQPEADTGAGSHPVSEHPPRPDITPRLAETKESEPNDSPQQAGAVALPATFAGVIAAPQDGQADQDLVRFYATEGQRWIFEVAAASQGSALDSRIDILNSQGQPIVRTRLQATRESYFTFRGKDSTTSDDFRLHKWEDMELDEYLYANGEVNRLWLYPRGPDSGFKVYPGAGKRHAFFDTTPLAHALGQPTYVVRELAAGESPLPNGLPVFPILYENDDDAQTRLGKDSRLTFVAPASGEYLLRVRDARDFGGDNFSYQVTIRQPQPDFDLRLADTQLSLPPGSGREWSVEATRIDGLDGPINIRLEGIPAGVIATNPLIIEAGQQSAVGAVFVTENIREHLGQESHFEVTLTATAQTGDRLIERALQEKLQVTISDSREVQLRMVTAEDPDREIDELSIRPGQTISARVIIHRQGTDSRVELGKEDAGRNLPHGAFVDNIGLNGLLIPEGQTEREFFITVAPKVAPGRRQFHLKSATAGKPTSRPVWLNVVAPASE